MSDEDSRTQKRAEREKARLREEAEEAEEALKEVDFSKLDAKAAEGDQPTGNMTPRTHYERSRKARGKLTLDIVMSLDAPSIDRIRSAFMAAPDQSVNLNQFIEIIRENVPRSQVRGTGGCDCGGM